MTEKTETTTSSEATGPTVRSAPRKSAGSDDGKSGASSKTKKKGRSSSVTSKSSRKSEKSSVKAAKPKGPFLPPPQRTAVPEAVKSWMQKYETLSQADPEKEESLGGKGSGLETIVAGAKRDREELIRVLTETASLHDVIQQQQQTIFEAAKENSCQADELKILQGQLEAALKELGEAKERVVQLEDRLYGVFDTTANAFQAATTSSSHRYARNPRK